MKRNITLTPTKNREKKKRENLIFSPSGTAGEGRGKNHPGHWCRNRRPKKREGGEEGAGRTGPLAEIGHKSQWVGRRRSCRGRLAKKMTKEGGGGSKVGKLEFLNVICSRRLWRDFSSCGIAGKKRNSTKKMHPFRGRLHFARRQGLFGRSGLQKIF